MKILLALSALVALSSTAFAGDQFVCQGIKGSEGNILNVNVLSSNSRDGENFPVHLILSNEDGVEFDGKGVGEQEDVNFTFKAQARSAANEILSIEGQIYLDELDQTSVTFNGVDYRFDCDYQE